MLSRSRLPAILSGMFLAVVVLSFIAARNVFAGSEAPPAAVQRERIASDVLPMRFQEGAEKLGIELESSSKVAGELFLVERPRHDDTCLVNTAYAFSLGCNPRTDFFRGEKIFSGMAEKGSPEDPEELPIGGIARPEVARVRVVLPSGNVEATPTADGAFRIVIGADQLRSGRPTELRGLDATGNTVYVRALPQE